MVRVRSLLFRLASVSWYIPGISIPVTQLAHFAHDASLNELARAGLPSSHFVRTGSLFQYFYIDTEGDTKGYAAHCQQAHVVVSARVVLPHGSHWLEKPQGIMSYGS